MKILFLIKKNKNNKKVSIKNKLFTNDNKITKRLIIKILKI